MTQGGLAIRAANGRDIWSLNHSALRLLRQASGALALQADTDPGMDDRPTIGGLVLWADEANYLRLDRGVLGARDIVYMGCVGGEDVVVGRGRLYEAAEPITLRLERTGDQVRALCSADGESWCNVGQVAFPAAGPVQVGVQAIGRIDRDVYLGGYRDGTAIRFESFQMWQIGD